MSYLYLFTIYPLEVLYRWIYSLFCMATGSYGGSLLLLSLCTIIFLTPLKRVVSNISKDEKHIQSILVKQISKIKSESTGRVRQERIAKLYDRYSYHPIMAIRNSLNVMLQIPFLMAAYYMIDGLEVLKGKEFLFLKDLSLPDAFLYGFNLLPIIMTLVNFATIFTTKDMVKKDKIQAFIIAILFFIMLYSAPSALLLYWTMNNFLYLLENNECFNKILNKIVDKLCLILGNSLKFIKKNISEFALASTIFFFVPVNLYIQNNNEFNFELSQVIGYFVFTSFLIFTVLFIFLKHIKKIKFLDLYSNMRLLIIGILIFLFFQAYIFQIDYGVLNGAQINWSKYKTVIIMNTIFFFFCLILPFLLNRLNFKELLKKIPIYLIMLECIFVSYNFFTIPITPKLGYYLSDDGLYEVSSKENILIFVLDSFNSSLFENIVDQNPELKNFFKDFIYYRNIVGAYPTTAGAMPQIITGQWYYNEKPYRQYIREAFENNKMLQVLKKNNFDYRLYTKNVFVPHRQDIDNLFEAKVSVKNVYGFMKKYLEFSFFRLLPDLLKRYSLISSDEIDENFQIKSGVKNAYSEDDVKFVEFLLKNGIQLKNKNGMFKIFHLRGAHPPYIINEDFKRVSENKTSLMQQALGSLKIVMEYIKRIKALGILKDSTIVIMADHGNTKYKNPLFLIKEKNADNKKMKINQELISYDDLHPIIMHAAGYEFERQKSKKNQIQYMYYSWDDRWGNMQFLPKMRKFYISGSQENSASWLSSHKIFYPQREEDENLKIRIGKIYFLGGKNDTDKYLTSGFSFPEEKHIWCENKKCLMDLEFDKSKKNYQTFKIDFDIFPFIYGKIKKQLVRIYINNQYIESWNVIKNGLYSISIPVSLLQNNKLQICFEIPNAASPEELGIGGDSRKLGIAFKSFAIYEIP